MARARAARQTKCLVRAFSSGTIADIAAKLDVSHGEAAEQLSQMLPHIINHLTPGGEAPAQGLGNSGDLIGLLGGLLKGRQGLLVRR